MKSSDLLEEVYKNGLEQQDWKRVLQLISIAFNLSQISLISTEDKSENTPIKSKKFKTVESYEILKPIDPNTCQRQSLPSNLYNVKVTQTKPATSAHTYLIRLTQTLPENIFIFAVKSGKTALNEQQTLYIESLSKHLARAYTLSLENNYLQAKNDSLKTALTPLPIGIAVINEELNVIHKNKVANEIINNKLEKSLKNKKLSHAIQNSLHNNIEEAYIEVNNKEEKHPTSILIKQLTDPIDKPKQLTLYLTHPDYSLFTDPNDLEHTFNLSKTEAKIALQLANGLNTQEIADLNNKSPQTLRTQLKSIYLKMNINSQTELIRKVLTNAQNLFK